MVHAMSFYTLVPRFFADPPSHSATRAAENRKALIPFYAKSSAESSGVRGWLWIRSRASVGRQMKLYF